MYIIYLFIIKGYVIIKITYRIIKIILFSFTTNVLGSSFELHFTTEIKMEYKSARVKLLLSTLVNNVNKFVGE